MANYRWFTKLHRKCYEITDGRLGAQLAGRPIALLYTVGCKSGQIRSIPLVYYDLDKDGIIVLASNNGSPKPPAWWLNLQKTPEIDVQIGRKKQRLRAEEVDDQRRLELWPQMVKANALIAGYPAKSGRKIPIILLRRIDS
jgi:deazaflavin-dependent oxidoreductase (nitroreductase family)